MEISKGLRKKILSLDFFFKDRCACCNHSVGIIHAKDTCWAKTPRGDILEDKKVAWWRDDTGSDHRFVLPLSEIEEVKAEKKEQRWIKNIKEKIRDEKAEKARRK